jgi:hypothetical protein
MKLWTIGRGLSNRFTVKCTKGAWKKKFRCAEIARIDSYRPAKWLAIAPG